MIAATEEMLPFLIIKRRIAEEFLRALSVFPTSKKGVNLHGGERVWTDAMLEEVVQIARSLNAHPKEETCAA